jgi:hypothetical protein
MDGPAQQVPHDQRQHQARLPAAGEGVDLGRGHFPDEVEAAQEAAQWLFAHVPGQLGQMPQRRLVMAQHFDLMLGKVADGQALAGRAQADGRTTKPTALCRKPANCWRGGGFWMEHANATI